MYTEPQKSQDFQCNLERKKNNNNKTGRIMLPNLDYTTKLQ